MEIRLWLRSTRCGRLDDRCSGDSVDSGAG